MRCRVDIGKLRHGVEDGVEIDHDFAAPVLRDLVDEFLPEAGRAARIRRRHDPALRRPELRVPARGPRVLPRALRPAVDEEHRRVLLRGIEVGGLISRYCTLRAQRAGHGQALGRRELRRPSATRRSHA